ncbi:alpha/beta hydrolase [Mucilaginibacter agri]|uniref:Alpha/beta hydrolase fold domain-containing protein n=1 Tax=Mucilaginibacter agri TaxID=2695265 RepID=A0A966DSE2_9SPHI|nr:alpha/beta hydrolase [Mucilaginibacter agri]NCD68152.1 alpha/beta hydrolase fold domain-containing protein [Mucilaginibacter agri]
MKYYYAVIILYLLVLSKSVVAQSNNPIIGLLPRGTIMFENLSYDDDTLTRHKLDIYVPPTGKTTYPVVVWLHGGGWRKGDKYSAMDFMGSTAHEMIKKGFAIVSINYRYSSTDKFPAQIQDCNDALRFINRSGNKYHLDKNNIAILGFSAGGHLAALSGLSNNNNVTGFYSNGQIEQSKIKLIIDYYGISDLETLTGPGTTDPNTGVQLLIGAKATEAPDKAREASPVSYIDKNDPPFLIVHGDKDQAVNNGQSIELSKRLSQSGVNNELVIVPGAPHGGNAFDAQFIRAKLFAFLKSYLK